jgi:hypothetical protein
MNVMLCLIAILIVYYYWLNANCLEDCLLITLFELWGRVKVSVKGMDEWLQSNTFNFANKTPRYHLIFV